jgi:membrane associated rhomboid family serine protease
MFIVLPVGMNYETRRAPVVTFTLMGLNTLIYVVSLGFTLGHGSDATTWIHQHLWLIPADSTWHTFLTSMFVHSGFFHLLGNMLYLFLFGCCVEDIIGRWRFLALYLLGGLTADLAYIALTPEHFASEIPMGGASGAISTCMGAYVLLRSKVDIDFKYFAFIFFRFFTGEFSLAAWVVISFWFLKDLFFAALSYYLDAGLGGVAFGAHVGGFVAGLGLIGVHKLFAPKEEQPRSAPVRVHLRQKAPALAPAPVPTYSEAPSIYVYDKETQYGPYGLMEIQQMLAQRAISEQALYWSEGMTEWRSVSELG